ncbi:MAG: rhodanese-like domain-containing protein [Cytophagales bacterium]|nr:rhodanese-like domain-containing protein [Cytophagales bacterium]
MNFKEIDPQEFNELSEKQKYVVLDVRSSLEAAQASIPNSEQINILNPLFRSKVEKLDKEKSYLVYCRSGQRSANACGIMDEMGFKNLHNLSGGIIAWKQFQKTT